MRVFELAKQLGIPSKDLIGDLKGIGVTVSNHMAALEDDTCAKILAKAAGKAQNPASLVKLPKTVEAVKPGRPLEEKPDKPDKADKERGRIAALRSKKTPPPVAEPPKAEKKMILVKRRPSETPLVGDVAPLTPVEEPAAISAGPADLSKVAAPPAPGPVHAEPSSHPARPLGIEPAVAGPSGSPGSLTPPATLPPQPPLSASDRDRHPAGKKGLPPEAPQADLQGLRDKVKKLRRVGRGREEEPIPTRDDATRWRDLRAMPMHRREEKTRHAPSGPPAEVTKPRLKAVKLSEGLTVKDFAEALGQKPAEVIRKLMDMGSMLTLNQSISPDAATLVAESFGVKVEMTAARPAEALLQEPEETEGAQVARPPVVTIMGHVDHGKTSLLDAIRQTRVTEGEAGGITQHIGAYVVHVHGKSITFLDTPGHEAFTAMRARGAKVTDLVVLVVAADDGVMPQTIEAIDHARAAGVPLIVAINKMDKPDANPDRVKNSLAERGLVPEAWGGDTIYVEVSAKKKTGLDTLLEMILLQAEVLGLRANPARLAKGTVKDLGIIIRADVQGSAEAIADAVERLGTEAVKPHVLLKGVGGITENDVQLAAASNAIIIGFNVRPEAKAAALAEREGVDIRTYSIIYEVLNDIKAAMEGLLEPTLKERMLGRAEVRQVFVIQKVGAVAGCYVTDGTIVRAGASVRVVRDGVVVYEGRLGSLRRFKDDVKEVQAGYECGITVENFNDIKPGDRFEVFTIDKVAAKL